MPVAASTPSGWGRLRTSGTSGASSSWPERGTTWKPGSSPSRTRARRRTRWIIRTAAAPIAGSARRPGRDERRPRARARAGQTRLACPPAAATRSTAPEAGRTRSSPSWDSASSARIAAVSTGAYAVPKRKPGGPPAGRAPTIRRTADVFVLEPGSALFETPRDPPRGARITTSVRRDRSRSEGARSSAAEREPHAARAGSTRPGARGRASARAQRGRDGDGLESHVRGAVAVDQHRRRLGAAARWGAWRRRSTTATAASATRRGVSQRGGGARTWRRPIVGSRLRPGRRAAGRKMRGRRCGGFVETKAPPRVGRGAARRRAARAGPSRARAAGPAPRSRPAARRRAAGGSERARSRGRRWSRSGRTRTRSAPCPPRPT